MLTALSLAVADSAVKDAIAANLFRFDECGNCDWLRTEAADATIALSESPHCAFAVALNATISTDKAATLPVSLAILVALRRGVYSSPRLINGCLLCQKLTTQVQMRFWTR